MDFMNYYGSDDEDNLDNADQTIEIVHKQSNKALNEPKLISPPQNINSRTTDIPVAKKKRILDISFLPSQIQEALMRGDELLDSDDDMTSKKPIKLSKKEDSKGDPLLNMLPAPQLYKKNEPEGLYPVSNKSKVSNSLNLVPIEKYSVDTLPLASNIIDSHSQNNPSFTYESNPYLSRQSIPPPSESRYAESHDNIIEYNETEIVHKKKRDRNIEQNLMIGNTSVLNHVYEVNTSNKWDAVSYAEKQKKEAEIFNSYTQDGSIKSIVQPTKLQNRRHQLSSLAMRAAETEIALMDSGGTKSKTKSQTQSRYGW